MIKNFSQYLVEEQREVFFTFGRMNPPTIGHGKVMDVLAAKSGKADYKVFISQTQDKKKNPLSYNDKVKHARKMFPKHARSIIIDKKVKTPIDALVALYDQGYKNVTMVVGDDRVNQFDVLFNQYNGKEARHGFYNFQSIKVISAGQRDPDADGIEGMSASKQRQNAIDNDFVAFSQGVPKAVSNADARKLFNDVRAGMGLKEEKEFKNHISLAPVSEMREKFVQGELFSVGDQVVIKETDEVGTVSVLGANYVIVETVGGKKLRKWLDAVELVENTTTIAEQQEPAKPNDTKKTFKDMFNEDCWDGYKQVGMKKKGGKDVPNCVPEENGAGDEGTDKLKKKYVKDTPQMKIDERSWEHDIGRLASKTVLKKHYNSLAKYAIDKMKNYKEGERRHSIDYWAAETVKHFNIKGISARALADVIRSMTK